MTNSKNQEEGINKFLKVDYLKAIRAYPIEIIALFPLVGGVAFGYRFYNSVTQIEYFFYSLLFFLVAVLVLLYIYRERNKTISNQIYYYPTMSEVNGAIKNIFKNILINSEITQTYIRNNFLAGSQDILFKNVFVHIKEKEKRPKINRIFILFDPLDINFAEHSCEVTNGRSIYSQEDYGGDINNIFIGSSSSDKIVKIIPNVTMADGKVLVTFPLRMSEHDRFSKKLVENPGNTSTKGVEVKNMDFYNEYKSYLTSAKTERLNGIKSQFYRQDKIAYYYSIMFSIAKELLHDDKLKDDILFLGIVGSLANYVESKTDNNDTEKINDLDFQIIFRELSSDSFKESKRICEHICTRFSIDNVVNFCVETKSTPVKSPKLSSGIPQIPIHLLLSDKKSCKKLDKFIAIDRVQHGGNVTFEWVLESNEKKRYPNELKILLNESFQDGFIRLSDLVNKKYIYSLSNCISVLEGNSHKLNIKEWKIESDGEYVLEHVEQELTPIELANFAKYSMKWGIINFFNSADNYNINNNSYNRDFAYALEQTKNLIISIDHEALINIYRMQDSEISEHEIKLIIDNIKTIEKYIKSKTKIT
jgi:cbb3-type cytochrome oxidase subunit 3